MATAAVRMAIRRAARKKSTGEEEHEGRGRPAAARFVRHAIGTCRSHIGISCLDFQDWRTQAHAFEGLAIVSGKAITFRDGDGRRLDMRTTTGAPTRSGYGKRNGRRDARAPRPPEQVRRSGSYNAFTETPLDSSNQHVAPATACVTTPRRTHRPEDRRRRSARW